ncbi:MAG: beta-ketoacyl-ACP synthase III, partial [Clostridia bacterium]
IVDTSDEWIVTRTGIRERRIADPHIATSDLATIAARRTLESAHLTPQDIDMIIVATVTPDMHFPSTACLVQRNIGATNASAFDLEAACSGFLYGIIVANQFVATGFCKNVMVIGAECMSKFVNWKDRNTCILFGDGAGAVVVSRVDEGYGFLSQVLGADGSGAELLMLEAGGSRKPPTFETVEKELHYIHMDGSEVFKFAVQTMAAMAEEAVQRAGLTKEQVDFLIPHQANIRIIEAARKKLELPEDKVYINLDRYGNMSAASIPVALDEAVKQGRIKKGHNIVMVGFGAGLTWGACTIRWAV